MRHTLSRAGYSRVTRCSQPPQPFREGFRGSRERSMETKCANPKGGVASDVAAYQEPGPGARPAPLL